MGTQTLLSLRLYWAVFALCSSLYHSMSVAYVQGDRKQIFVLLTGIFGLECPISAADLLCKDNLKMP